MADTRCQLECEDWVRQEWMQQEFGQRFHRERVRLSSGGVFDFDAVSADGTTVASISTSGSRTGSGKLAVGKLMKIRSDMLFLLLAAAKRSLMIFTEKDMYDLCIKEIEGGRAPENIECFHAQLPADLAAKLQIARRASSEEVSPRRAAVETAMNHD